MITTLNTPSMATEGGKSNTGLIILGVALAAAAGYYFFVYKPAQEEKKQQA